MNQDQLRKMVDGLFKYLELQAGGHIMLVMMLDGLRRMIDDIGIPALFAWLKQHGYIE